MITLQQLQAAMPNAPGSRLALYAGLLSSAMAEHAITNPAREAAFIAQVGHESGDFARTVENLNYSAEGLRRTWPARFSPDMAAACARQPERIANVAYADRMGNGDEASGDGWRYRGGGLIQITGRANYKACGEALGLDLISNPELIRQPDGACRSAAWFWRSRGLNELADAGDFERITRLINGGLVGLEDRRARWEKAKEALA